jgi:hypothetical protein
MDILDAIGQLGFRRWYQRKLIEAHAWLISGLLALVLAVSLMEIRSTFSAADTRLALSIGTVLALVGVAFAWNRYRSDLKLAEYFGELASCPACQTYGRFAIIHSRLQAGEQPAWMNVCCRKCGQAWRMEAPS